MTLSAGTRLGLYEITAQIGVGLTPSGLLEADGSQAVAIADEFIVVQNWFEELKRRAPAN